MVSQENSLQDFPKIIFLPKKIEDWLAPAAQRTIQKKISGTGKVAGDRDSM